MAWHISTRANPVAHINIKRKNFSSGYVVVLKTWNVFL
jgi:hypothetical protein